MIVGWSLSSSLRTEMPLEALEMALWQRGGALPELVHHSDRGCQYTSIRYTERLAEAGIAPSIGAAGDAYDNAMAESTIGLDIPSQAGHPFRPKAATHSEPRRPPIPL